MGSAASPGRFWLTRLVSAVLGIGGCFLIQTLSQHSLGDYQQRLVFLAALYVTLSVSLNLINGITGQFSIGHAAFYQIGAYSAGYFSKIYIHDQGHNPPALPWLIGVTIVGAGCAAIAGFVVGLPSLRLRGDYLAIVTLGFGEIVRITVQNTDALGGSYALQDIPKIHPVWLVWLLALICVAVSRNLVKTARGLTFLAVREDEIASQAMGVDVTRVKVTAFVLGAAFAGAAGSLFAHYEGSILPTNFTMDVSFIILTMVVLGGTGSITGSVISALFLFYLPEYLRGLKASDGQALTVSSTLIIGGLLSIGIVTGLVKKIMEDQRGTPQSRGLIYVGLVAAGVVFVPILNLVLSTIKPLAEKHIPTDQLRMVIFAVALIVIMLLRPQGLLGHHEFSWSMFGGSNRGKPEVAT
ncbi:MAG TPA: branched-chain amino acid ABC transporter permease [Fimbriimonas sp.]|nr:branched-chain amino acid ABC transporter permease [Fimbriimonas sp.]